MLDIRALAKYTQGSPVERLPLNLARPIWSEIVEETSVKFSKTHLVRDSGGGLKKAEELLTITCNGAVKMELPLGGLEETNVAPN
ncbi:hypothetical protein L1049_003310 [Liquidambar formosana]|uniref:Uncharacterized protein n=1 Tax=Liquidambar formosana TaxID=63359 RepID=A0AAP0NJ50_LIQFO